jgi:ribosomal protein L32E
LDAERERRLLLAIAMRVSGARRVARIGSQVGSGRKRVVVRAQESLGLTVLVSKMVGVEG